MTKRKVKATRRRGECYLNLQFWELDSPAFLALSADATRVYLFMRKRLNFDNSNNGQVPFSHRDAAEALHAGWRRGSNALAELQHFRFIKYRNAGEPGRYIRLASEWQLTAFPCGGQEASKDFMRHDGTPFEPPKRGNIGRPTIEKRASEKQLPICNMKTPRRQHEDASPCLQAPKDNESPQSVGNMKTPPAGERRQHEDTITVTTQRGPSNQSQNTSKNRAAAAGAPSANLNGAPDAHHFLGKAEYAGKPTLPVQVLGHVRGYHPNRTWRRSELSEHLDVAPVRIGQALKILCERGHAERVGHGVYLFNGRAEG
jgi:hypothetical protein